MHGPDTYITYVIQPSFTLEQARSDGPLALASALQPFGALCIKFLEVLSMARVPSPAGRVAGRASRRVKARSHSVEE